ncbi:MAG: outer membrane beta-barrel protein [Candidatus Amoebophilus sp.]
MRKTIGLVLFLIGISSTTHAYVFKVGPRIGISTYHIRLDEEGLAKCYDPHIGLGYQAGIVGRVDFPVVYIQPELLFTYSKVKYQNQCPNEEHVLRYKKIELPVLFGIKIMEIVRLQVGPVFSLLLSAKSDTADIYAECKSITAGYQVGIGVDFQRFIIDLKYEGSLNKVCSKLGNIAVDHRKSLFMLSVGVNIL